MAKTKPMGLEIKCMTNRIGRHLQYRMSHAGFDEVTILHGWILDYIQAHDGEDIYQKDFEEKFGMAKSTVTGTLKLLEKKGYITRTAVEHDARLKAIKLTPLGMQIHHQTGKVIESMNSELEEGISKEDRENFFRVLNIICNNMDSAEERIEAENK